MKVGIVGCGFIGAKRAANMGTEDQITGLFDTNRDAANKLACVTGAQVHADLQALLSSPEVDAVVVATTHEALAAITSAALVQKKHVLVEKPGARNADELRPVVELYRGQNQKHGVVAKVGFNHRFHPALQKAREIVVHDGVGELMFIRGRYGHGGRVGYDKEWRMVPAISGGGELLDQGMHLIDLTRWFMGDIEKVSGLTRRYFWNCEVEDNAFLLLESRGGQVAQLQVSWTEWKNLFSFEIYYRNAKLHIEGLGGSYGTERLSCYKMKPEMGPPETTIFEYPGKDISWEKEWQDFRGAIANPRSEPLGTLEDALSGLEIVSRIYAENKQ
jgi:predicted dehydrogenase